MKGKGKRKLNGWIIALIVVAFLAAVGGIIGWVGWSRLQKEHEEARSIPLDAVDFNKLNDGTYHGAYAGGMYAWRVNECDVTVTNGEVIDIRLAATQDPAAENMDPEMLYDRVIKAQSLQVDTISGATLTSKAYLKCVENALLQAQQQ